MLDIGGINLFSQGLNNEFSILVLEKTLEKIINQNSFAITTEDVDSIRKQALEILKKKYPNAGITRENF